MFTVCAVIAIDSLHDKPCTAVVLAILLPELYTLANLSDIYLYAYDIILLINGVGLSKDYASNSLKAIAVYVYLAASVAKFVNPPYPIYDVRILHYMQLRILWPRPCSYLSTCAASTSTQT